MAEVREGQVLGRERTEIVAEPADPSLAPEPMIEPPVVEPRERRRLPMWVAVLVLVLAAGFVAVLAAVPRLQESSLTVGGITPGATLNAADAAQATVTIGVAGRGAGALRVLVDGSPIEPVASGEGYLLALPPLSDGEHHVVIQLDGRFGADPRAESITFTVDSSGPTIVVPSEIPAARDDERLVVTGLVDGATSLTVAGADVPIEGGAFRSELPAMLGPIEVVATDEMGNSTSRSVLATATPTPPAYPATNGVHVGQSAWADPVRREAILALARSGQINAVQLDIKDEVGDLGYPSNVALATTIGAKMDFYDARAALDQLHALGVKVIGRVVCFLDPTLARWALANGEADWVVSDGTGVTPLPSAEYGDAAFTNFVHPDVQQYNIDLGVEALGLGFDEIIYDYVRRPEGDLAGMTFPGIDTSPEVAIARFVQRSSAAFRPLGGELGLSVFGISSTRPTEIAQDIRLLAPLVDYIAPMVYPQVWAEGEYGVERPNRQPYDIVYRSLVDFHHVAAGSGAAIVPWLQDYTFGSFEYTDLEVAAQVQAAKDAGSNGYLMWNARAEYHAGGIQPIEAAG